MPHVKFAPAPFNPHVIHQGFLPERRGLPAELYTYVDQQGDGHTCYLRGSQWSLDGSTLALVVWQISRIVTLTAFHGESVSLNTAARDHALRLAEEGRLPLGPALPPPAGGAISLDEHRSAMEEIQWQEGEA